MDGQLGIKILLIAGVLAVALFILWPGRGARRLALRRIGTLLLVLVAIAAIVFPQFLSVVAEWLGVGRGADLLLYGTVIVFLGWAFLSRVERRRMERQITRLARAQALAGADRPWEQR
ncbi:MAG: hypothetical protein BGO95_07850 [Micrococcales bacterium 73-13]|nr:MAG: hypothetical protein BGO95_07850 [Micrococcales bacterium 73-13]